MSVAAEQNATRRPSVRSNDQIFRNYYTDNDIFYCPEGILKLLSVLVCASAGAVSLSGAWCAGAAGAARAVRGAALAVAAAQALLAAGLALGAPLLAPQPWLYVDVVVAAAGGALLLLCGALSAALCGRRALHILPGFLAIAAAALVVGSAALTYRAAMRAADAVRASRPAHGARRGAPEHEV